MALAGELAKYVGKELVNTGSKALAKAGATSALSSLVPSAVTKVGADLANKSVLSSLVPATARKLASGIELGAEAIPLFRGQMNRLDRLDYNNPNGVSPNSNGFFMTPNKGATDSWAGKGVVSVDADPNDIMTLGELEGLKKDAERYFSDPKYQMQIYNTNPRQAEIYDALEASDNYQSLSQLTNKPFIERDGGQGRELGELVFFPDTRPELTAKYNDILASGKNQWATSAVDNAPSPTSLPVGTQIKFNKDLSIKSIDKPSKGRGWFADNVKNPHISKMVKENGLDKYLGGRMLDKTGKPITFYHSTPNEFSKFDDARLGENTGYDNTALGHFVTTDKDFSKRFIDIDNTGKTGRTMELRAKIQKPITHPYMAGQKYDKKELDKIVEDYLIATNNQDGLESLRELAEEDGTSLYDEYMDMTLGADSPFEYAADDRKALLDNGYDAVEIVEGPKSGLVEGSNDDSIVSSYAVLNGDNLVPVRHIPVQQDNYVPLYHQTSANSLADFSLGKRSAGVSDATMPEGIFLKETNADIGLPGKNQLQLDAKLNNPLRVINRDDLKAKLIAMNPKVAKYLRAENDIDNLYEKLSDEAQTAVDKAYEKMYYDKSDANKKAFAEATEKMNGIIPEWREKIKENAATSQKEIKKLLKENGYDGMIMDEDRGSFGRKVKSYLVLDKEQLRDNSVPVKFVKKSSGKPDMQLAKIEEPDAKYAKLVNKAKGYKSLDRFEKMNNPIKGSVIWGEKPTSAFQRDSRAVRINMFPNEAVKGTGITKQYLLNLFKDAYDQGITDIVPSYGSYTKEGASFMDHLAEQGWIKDTSKNGWKSYEISPKIAEWEKTSPLADIYNNVHNIPEVQQSKIGLRPEQAEFFKDSVVRDKDGNLMPVFHTTNTNKRIDVFNADNGMVWVTPNKMYSTGFAGNGYNPDRTYELYANIKNPVYVGNIDPAINDKTIEKLSAYTGVDEETLLAIAEKYDARNIWKITNSKDFKELMQAKGYDGIEAREGGNQVSYAAFSPEQVKRVDNLNPTNNPDVRYAKDTGRSLVEMHKRLQAMNKSRELDPNVKRIGNSAVAEVDAKTLPAGYEKVKKYLETSPNDVLYNALGVNLDDVDVSEWGDIIKNWIEEQGYEADKNVANNLTKVREIVAEQLAEELSLDGSPYAKFVQTRNALAKDNPGKGVGVKDHTISANDDQIYQTDAAKLDREYSDRLGIGRSHTPMSDNALAGDAQGVYFAGGIGVKPEFAQGETGVSTIAHERLHSWQDARRGEWDDRVIDAIEELRGELKNFYHTKDQIKKYRKSSGSLDYYANEHEQEARMLQSYLDNEGYTNTWKKNVADGTEWGDEVKPAFDKFYKKLRSLSKAGVALPAIAVLFGLNTNTGKKLDKKS